MRSLTGELKMYVMTAKILGSDRYYAKIQA